MTNSNAQSDITVSSDELRGYYTPLYTHYSGQIQPQEAFVRLTEDGEVYTGYQELGGGMPECVWSGRTVEWEIDPRVDGDDLDDTLNDPKNIELFERVFAGNDIEDGRGQLDDDAQDAFDELQAAFEGVQTWMVMDIGDAVYGNPRSYLENAGSIEAAINEIESDAIDVGAFVGSSDREMREYLQEWIEENDFEFPAEKDTAAASLKM